MLVTSLMAGTGPTAFIATSSKPTTFGRFAPDTGAAGLAQQAVVRTHMNAQNSTHASFEGASNSCKLLGALPLTLTRMLQVI